MGQTDRHTYGTDRQTHIWDRHTLPNKNRPQLPEIQSQVTHRKYFQRHTPYLINKNMGSLNSFPIKGTVFQFL